MLEACQGRVDAGACSVYVKRDKDHLVRSFLFFKGGEKVLTVKLPEYEPDVDVEMVSFQMGHSIFYYRVEGGYIRIDAKEEPALWACALVHPIDYTP